MKQTSYLYSNFKERKENKEDHKEGGKISTNNDRADKTPLYVKSFQNCNKLY